MILTGEDQTVLAQDLKGHKTYSGGCSETNTTHTMLQKTVPLTTVLQHSFCEANPVERETTKGIFYITNVGRDDNASVLSRPQGQGQTPQ